MVNRTRSNALEIQVDRCFGNIRIRSQGSNSQGVDLGMALGILKHIISNKSNQQAVEIAYVVLNVLEISGLFETMHIMINILQPFVKDGIICANGSQVALEVLYIDGIESDGCRVDQNIELRELLSEDIGTTIRMDELLNMVQCGENNWNILVIGLLVRRKPGLVDTTVEVSGDPCTSFINLVLEMFWVKIQVSFGATLWQQFVESCLKPSQRLNALVAHNGVLNLVPNDRDRVSALVSLVGAKVHIMHVPRAKQMIFGSTGISVVGAAIAGKLPTGPTIVVALGIRLHNGEREKIIQLFD